MKKSIVFSLAAFVFLQTAAFSQARFSLQGHEGKANVVFADANNEGSFYSAGDDGMIIHWKNESLGEHFKVSENKILLAAALFEENEIAFYETDGNAHCVKIWDIEENKIKRSYNYNEPVLSIAYSAQGTYLIVTTAATNGLYLYTAKTGKPYTKIKGVGSIVSWAKTGTSEKNIMLYSTDGTLAYYNLASGKLVQKSKTESALQSPVLFARNSFIAGIKNKTIYIANAENGNLAKQIKANSPRIFAADDSLYYLDGERGNLSLFVVRASDAGLKGPAVFKTLSNTNSEIPAAAQKSQDMLFLASESGNVYKTNLQNETPLLQMELVSNNSYKPILDICASQKNIFILTDSKIIKASYKGGVEQSIPNKRGFTKIEYASNYLILRTENRADGIYSVSEDLDSAEKFLFAPTSRVNKIRACVLRGNKGFLEIENSRVNFYNLEDHASENPKELFSGSGIQDAVICNEDSLFIAKTASSKPNSPMILVNTKTYETVPIKIDGDIAYCLEQNQDFIFGAMLTRSAGGYSSSIFSLDSKNFNVKNIFASEAEDAHALLLISNTSLYTNMASSEINSFNIKTNKKSALKGGDVDVEKIALCGELLAVLNKDTSITWHNTQQASLLTQWYLGLNGEIIEF